jgi:hypothetical protein
VVGAYFSTSFLFFSCVGRSTLGFSSLFLCGVLLYNSLFYFPGIHYYFVSLASSFWFLFGLSLSFLCFPASGDITVCSPVFDSSSISFLDGVSCSFFYCVFPLVMAGCIILFAVLLLEVCAFPCRCLYGVTSGLLFFRSNDLVICSVSCMGMNFIIGESFC